ncbi:hypothetical protein [Nocardia sp. NPDC046763]|uniref:hypothetical protein n=1 Tax=Nocardia sp. NPDC046763 TaxID=3155256 RepID=UPI00340EB85E
MALRISGRAITSDMTPETAHLVFGPDGGTWVLSWLPGWDLTREQAIDGMALDEILSDPTPADGEFALEMAALRAESLGLPLEDAVVRLFARIAERDRQQQAGADGADGPPGNSEGPCRTGRPEAIHPRRSGDTLSLARGGERPTVRIVDSRRRRAAHPMPGEPPIRCRASRPSDAGRAAHPMPGEPLTRCRASRSPDAGRAAHPMPGSRTPLGDFSLISPDDAPSSRCR